MISYSSFQIAPSTSERITDTRRRIRTSIDSLKNSSGKGEEGARARRRGTGDEENEEREAEMGEKRMRGATCNRLRSKREIFLKQAYE